ncbi:MAG: hypothetical protein WD226_00785 [Planctomycetota bacterium]
MPRPPRVTRALLNATACLPLLLGSTAIVGCASVDFERTSPNAGEFRSSALSLTFFGFDFPTHALLAARANASDAQQPNTEVSYERVFPYFGAFDWLLDLVSIRWAVVRGTWGYED